MIRLSLCTALLAPAALAACAPAGEQPADGVRAASGAQAPGPAPADGSGAPPRSPDIGEPPPEQGDTCQAELVRARWLGARPDDAVKAAIAGATGNRPTRYYAKGDPLTMDYSPERLTIGLGEDGRIKEVRCG